MTKNIGQIVYNAIKKQKYSIGFVSSKLQITRNTLYNKLKKENLSLEFVIKVGNIIEYDFDKEIPEIIEYATKKNIMIHKDIKNKQSMIYKLKYLNLMYNYNSLLDFMINLADNHNLESLKKDIREFVKMKDPNI